MRVIFAPLELRPFRQALRGEPVGAAHLVLAGVATRLRARGHAVTFLVPRELGFEVCTADPEVETPGPASWSTSPWFRALANGAWRLQRAVGLPYLNVFTNLALYDVSLRCLPGHDVLYQRHSLYRDGLTCAAARLGMPHVLLVEADEILEHDLMKTPLTGLLRWRAARIFQRNLRAADRVIVVSEPLKAHLAAVWQVPSDRVAVLPNAVDSEVFRPDADARRRVRGALGIAHDAPVVLFVGSFYEWHDVDTVLRAASTIVGAHPDLQLVLVGDGAKRTAMQERAAALGLGAVTRFVGMVAHGEVPQYVATADVAVVPYPRLPREIWLSPMKLFEYMASGAAIVASAAGQVTEVLHDGVNALLVPPGDVVAMAEAFTRLISDGPLRAALGAQARADAVRRHSWDQYITRLEKMITDAIATRGARAG